MGLQEFIQSFSRESTQPGTLIDLVIPSHTAFLESVGG